MKMKPKISCHFHGVEKDKLDWSVWINGEKKAKFLKKTDAEKEFKRLTKK